MDNRPILVQLNANCLTVEVMHLACAIARGRESQVVLVRMIPVQHIGWLGTELGQCAVSIEENDLIKACKSIAETYGVVLETMDFQYAVLDDALAEVAVQANAQAIFATLPAYPVSWWRRFLNWRLKRHLTRLGCDFYDLRQVKQTEHDSPSVLIPARGKITSSL